MAKKTSIFKEFGKFINRGNAIDMAVGIIVGSVMTGVVNSLVKDVMMPPIDICCRSVKLFSLSDIISAMAVVLRSAIF